MQRKTLTHTARVWFPRARRGSPPVEQALFDLKVAAGGWTEYKTDGGWLNSGGRPVNEPVSVYEFAYDDKAWQIEPAVYHAAQALLDAGEEAVLVELDGRKVLLS